MSIKFSSGTINSKQTKKLLKVKKLFLKYFKPFLTANLRDRSILFHIASLLISNFFLTNVQKFRIDFEIFGKVQFGLIPELPSGII